MNLDLGKQKSPVFFEYGLYILVALAFFHGWIIDLSKYQSLRDYPFLSNLNAPAGDFWSALVLLCFSASLIGYRLINKEKIKIATGLWQYGIFLLIALASAFMAYDHNVDESLWYFWRFIVFSFVAYFVLPQYLIQNKKVLHRVFDILIWVGVIISLYAFGSIFVINQSWFRLTPYALFGFAPLGFNHNAIAQPLTVIWPVGLYLCLGYLQQANKRAWWYGISAGLMLVAALLTLSRGAWLSILIQALILAVVFWPDIKYVWQKHNFQKNIISIGLVLSLAVVYMLYFLLTSNVVVSSNVSRLQTTAMSWFYFTQAPYLGYGPGMYLHLISSNMIYVAEFGEPIEAHGFVQKIIVEEGGLALIAFLGFLVWLLRKIWLAVSDFKPDEIGVFLFVMVLGAVVLQLFDTMYFSPVMWLPLGLAISAMSLKNKENV